MLILKVHTVHSVQSVQSVHTVHSAQSVQSVHTVHIVQSVHASPRHVKWVKEILKIRVILETTKK